ncbi:hypothetical protein COU20_01675, partial [Candidatus Kaiserbacteria bacterium CG10_big_fil_rev_8_21_14_0_10_59_10]
MAGFVIGVFGFGLLLSQLVTWPLTLVGSDDGIREARLALYADSGGGDGGGDGGCCGDSGGGFGDDGGDGDG